MRKRSKYLLVVVIGVVLVGGWWLFKPTKEDFLDLSLAMVTDNGLAMINVSPERRMINVVDVSEEREVWIPGGLGWYRSDRVKKILEQENKQDKVEALLFYNFGFKPKDVLWKNDWEGELSNQDLLKYWGIKGWINYRLNSGNWLFKKEVFSQVDGDEKINEIMQRDMAETSWNKMETKIIVGNASRENGLGNFVTKSLERSGLSVMDVVNVGEDFSELCLMRVKKTVKIDWMEEIFSECTMVVDDKLGEDEVEIYFGQKWAEMLNYQSYVRTF